MHIVCRWGITLCCVLILGTGAGCSLLGDSKPVTTPKQSVKGPTDQKQQVDKQEQPKVLIKPIPKKEVTISAAEQLDLKKLTTKTIIYKGSGKSKRVALTFDDGPDDQITLKILGILRKEQVRATFFVTGKMVRKYPQILKQIDQEGHLIGNHTWGHPQLTKLSPLRVHKEVNDTTRIIQKQIGKRVTMMRPPYGATNKKVTHELLRNHYYIINWDVDTNDWRGRSRKQIEQSVRKDSKHGSIILQHNAGNNLQGTVAALPSIIAHFKELGYEMVTLDQLLSLPPYQGQEPDVTLAPPDEPSSEEQKLHNDESSSTKPMQKSNDHNKK